VTEWKDKYLKLSAQHDAEAERCAESERLSDRAKALAPSRSSSSRLTVVEIFIVLNWCDTPYYDVIYCEARIWLNKMYQGVLIPNEEEREPPRDQS
jgi:hypothetical protein